MSTYKPKKKIDENGTLEEIKIPIESVDGLSDILDTIPSESPVIDLGTITESPESLTNSVLNANKAAGLYTFKYGGTHYMMACYQGGPNGGRQNITYYTATAQYNITRTWDYHGFSSVTKKEIAYSDNIPTSTSQLTNDSGFLTGETDTLESVTTRGAKTTKQINIQNGSASGSLQIGADVNASTLTAGKRKLARITAPVSETDSTTVAGILSYDSGTFNATNTLSNGVEFGSRNGDATSVGVDYMSFSVAKQHNATVRNNVAQFLSDKVQLFNHKADSTSIEQVGGLGLEGMWEFTNDNKLVNNGYTYTMPNKTGTVATTSDIPTTTSQLTNNSDFATNSSVDTKIANLVNSAPEALNTLGELATALETHEDAYDALLETVGKKANKSDINALVATTAQEFNSLITIDNKGKTISYNGNLYIVNQEQVSTVINVGDTIQTLYFNTDIEPDFSTIEITEAGAALFETQRDSQGAPSLCYANIGLMTDGIMPVEALYLLLDDNVFRVLYATDDFDYFGVLSGTKGWNVDSYDFGRGVVVTSVSQVDKWANYVSTQPFGGDVEATRVCEEELSKKADTDFVQDEFNKKGIHYIPKSEFTTVAGSSSNNQYTSHKLCLPNVDGVTTPIDGMTISFPMPLTDENRYAKLAISIDGGNTYYPAGTTTYGFKVTIQEDSITTLLFNANKVGEIFENGVSTQITGCWQITNYDSDQNVFQEAITDSSTDFPVLITPMTGWSSFTSNVAFSNKVTVSPYRGRVSAKEFKENGVSLADKYALRDEISNGITFIPKNTFVVGTASSDRSMKWTINGGIDGITKPFDGMVIAFMIPKAPPTYEPPIHIAMSINGGAEYHPLTLNDGSPLTQEYFTENDIILVAYNASKQATAYLTSGTQTLITGCWQVINTNIDGVEKINLINTGYYNTSTIDSIDENGITYRNGFQFQYANNKNAKTGEYKSTLPIVAGDRVEITYDVNSEGGDVAKINITGGVDTLLVEITYNELKALRDDSKLVAGQYYCITDYACTTSQINTRATASTNFDIIVQALSNNILSENASVRPRGEKPTLKKSVLTNKQVKSRVIIYYREYIDYDVAAGLDPDYRSGKDYFVDFDYIENNVGETVPVIYKTDALGLDPTLANYNSEFDGADYADSFFYEGAVEINGETYDKWRLINEDEDIFTWDSAAKSYVYTNQIVDNGAITIDPFLYEVETDEYRLDSSAVNICYFEFIDFPDGEYDLQPIEDKKFAAYEYMADSTGNIVPVLHDWDTDGDTIGYNENYYYDGKVTIDGALYDRWRKIELDSDDFDWDTPGKAYYYTNVIVETTASNSDIKCQSWEIKYCLDNDKTRFWWADESQMIVNLESGFSNGTPLTRQPLFDGSCPVEQYNEYRYAWGTQADIEDDDAWDFIYSKNEILINRETVFSTQAGGLEIVEIGGGKGVIYYMKDEYGNECPYDFKNIQFKRWQTDAELETDDKFYSSWDDTGNDFRWCYTFMANGTTNDAWVDASIIKPYRLMSDENKKSCLLNTIKPHFQFYDGDEETNEKDGVQWLNNIVLYGSYEDAPAFGDGYSYNYIQLPYANAFGMNCHEMTLGRLYGCDNNTFGANCHSNTFGSSCLSNTFGANCYSNTFESNCYYNTFGHDCYYNTFGSDCYYNTFVSACGHNTLSLGCNNNIFENDVCRIILQPESARYVHIHSGVGSGTFEDKIITVTPGATFATDVRTADDVTITV